MDIEWENPKILKSWVYLWVAPDQYDGEAMVKWLRLVYCERDCASVCYEGLGLVYFVWFGVVGT